MERWKKIRDYPYEVSSLGSVRNLKGLVLKQRKLRGYLSVSFYLNGDYRTYKVHRLVMEAFKGSSVLQVDHIDGNKENNRLDNLRYVDAKGNSENRSRLGRTARGSKLGNSVWTETEVLAVKNMLSDGIKPNQIARWFGRHSLAVWRIQKGLTWAHVKGNKK